MANDLVLLEEQLLPLAPHFQQVLPANLPVERLIRTVIVSCERTPKLLDCNRQSIFNAAMSAAVLGLEVDGATGQAFLIPYGNRAQLVIGYKGYSTIAARSGYTISGGVVREEDVFEYEEGSSGFVKHVRKLGGEKKRRIIAAWATAKAEGRPPIVSILSIDELLAVKAKSPGARKQDSPWNDTDIGFPAMCEKTAKRRLARSMPLNVMQLGARMDEAFDEQGQHSWIDREKGLVVEGEFSPIPEREASVTPTAEALTAPSVQPEHPPVEIIPALEYADRWKILLDQAKEMEKPKEAAKLLLQSWNSDGQKEQRRAVTDWPANESDWPHWKLIQADVVVAAQALDPDVLKPKAKAKA